MSELIPRSDIPPVFREQMQMAEVLANSTLLPGHLRGKPANVLLILSGARALDIPAFWALQSMHVIDGKLSMSAELMRALVIRAGHKFRIVERSAQRAVVEITRKDRSDQPYRFEFTIADAAAAELAGKGNWKKYPKAMLVARATSGAVRDECPDVLFGVVYTPDELGAVTDDEGNPTYADDGRTIVMPTPDAVADCAETLRATITVEALTVVWQEIVDRGWPLEKIPDSDMSLLDLTVAIVRAAARGAASLDEIREWWQFAGPAGLLAQEVSADDDTDRIKLGDYMVARGDLLLQREAAAKPAVTEHAANLQQAARDSWEEQPETASAPEETHEPG